MIKILNSKLLIPDVTESIKRERLASLLNEASQKTLVNVVAEAGYGKTTLVAQHLRSSTRKAVWYKLDRYDNDLVTFIKYLIAGIGKHYPEFGKETLQRIEDLHTIGSVRKDMLTILASEFEKTIRSDLFIVFDDYHTVPESKEITEAVEFFLEYLPPQVHIIIVSRSIPDLAISRLRSAGKVLDLGTQDLAFTDVEIQQLFRKLFDIHLPSGSLKILEEKTGGWVAALMLFYLHSKGKAPREIEKQIKDLKGSLQLYSNYMDENIFGRLSENTKDFLTKTSVLSRLNADFCDRFLKQSNSRDILHELEKSHIFTFALDDERKWYCYHQLFQDYLLAKLQSDLSKKAVQKLHEEAAGLLELAEEPEVALDHYLQAERYEQVCRLMDKTASAWLREGRLQLVGSYLKRIPQKLVKSQAWYHRVQPRLLELTDSLQAAVDGYQEAHGFFRDRNSREDSDNCLLAVGRIHLMNGNFEIAGKKLEKLIKNKTLSPNHRIEALGNLIYIASFSNKAIVADQYLEETLSLLPKGERSSREYLAGLYITLCHKHFNTNDFEKAAQLGAKALELSKTIRRTPYLIGCYYYTSLAFSAQGKFREGLETADQGLQLIEENKLCGGLNHCMILHCLAENSTGIGNTDQAIHYATESLEYARILDSGIRQAMAFYQLSLAYFYSDDILQATANAGKAVLSIEDLEPSKIRSMLNVQLALSLIVKGELDEALAIIREAEDIPGNPKAPKSLVFYAYALYYWEKGRKELALQQLLNCLENSLTTHYHLRLVMEKKRIIRPLVEIWAKGKVRDYILKLLDMMKANVGEDLLSIADSGDDKLKAAASEILAGIAPLPTPDLRAEFLGKFEVALGQKAIPPSRWKSKKAKMLFKYLVFKRGKGYVPKEILIELLWPEESPAKTNKRFHVAMASLRKTLEPGLRRGTPSSYILREADAYTVSLGDNGEVDVDEFYSHLEKAQRESHQETAVRHLQNAASIYRGNFLEEDPFIDWCTEERERIQRDYLLLLSKIIEYHDTQQNHSTCIHYAGKYLEIDKYAESIYQQLMRYHAKNSNKTMVKKTFEKCRQLFLKELDCPLSQETETLYQQLIRQAGTV